MGNIVTLAAGRSAPAILTIALLDAWRKSPWRAFRAPRIEAEKAVATASVMRNFMSAEILIIVEEKPRLAKMPIDAIKAVGVSRWYREMSRRVQKAWLV